jgi:hypothetical protein
MKRLTEGQADIQRRWRTCQQWGIVGEFALDLAKLAGVNPTPATLYRIQNGFSIARGRLITYSHTDHTGDRFYQVGSQTDSRDAYHVRVDKVYGGSCTCGDWTYNDMRDHKAGNPFSLHHCKHLLATKILEAQS